MTFAVVGAGAIGGLLGARLALAGEKVTFVARGANLEAIRRNGFTLIEEDGTERKGRLRRGGHRRGRAARFRAARAQGPSSDGDCQRPAAALPPRHRCGHVPERPALVVFP